jgi:hypothetical protein
MNALHYGQAKRLRTVQSAYSNDTYEEIPFCCDPGLTDEQVRCRVAAALHKRFRPSCHAGCGYSCTLDSVTRTSRTGGVATVMHYCGIGD